MKTTKYSLYAVVGIIVVTSVVAAMGLYSLISYQSTKKRIINNTKHHSTKTLDSLNKSISSYIESYSINEYEDLVLHEMVYANFDAIVVHNYKMGELLGQDAYVSGKIRDADKNVLDYDQKNKEMNKRLGECFLTFTSSMTSETGVELGEINICTSSYAVEKELRETIRDSLTSATIIAFTLILLLFITIHRIVLKPISRMVRTLSRTDADGIPVGIVSSQGALEIKALASSIISMIATIKNSRKKLEKQHELALAEQKQREIIWSINVGTWEWNVQTGEIAFNERWAEIIGHSLAEISPASRDTWREFVHPEDLKNSDDLLAKHFAGKLDWYQCEIRMKHKDGHWVWVADHGKVVEWIADGIPLRMAGSHSDVTARKNAEEQLRELSLYDSLTGLYNRNYFEQEMLRLKDGRSLPLGIIVCDVDGLKVINDSFGHAAGDELIQSVGESIKSAFRDSDMVARIGGDEFVVLLPYSDIHAVSKGVQRIRQGIERKNSDATSLPISISIGYSVCAEKPLQIEVLFKEADNHMYTDKAAHKEKFSQELLNAIEKRLDTLQFAKSEKSRLLKELVEKMADAINLEQKEKDELILLSRYYDIGNVGIPREILEKPAPLTDKEKMVMRKHTEIGHRLARFFPEMNGTSDYILMHHERWDGKGYPLGKKEVQIPRLCRMISIAVAFVSMTTDRPFCQAMSTEAAVDEIRKCKGTQFDPELVEILTQVLNST